MGGTSGGDSGDLVLTAGAVAQRLGVAVSTLRTWDRRYGLGASGHQAGRHRRYTGPDLVRLQRMRRLTFEGVPPAVAARLVQDSTPSTATVRGVGVGGRVVTRLDVTDRGGRDGGGHALPVGRSGPKARGLARAAIRLDGVEVRRLVTDGLARDGVVPTWQHMVVPALVAAGRRWERTGNGVHVEHILTGGIAAALHTVPVPAGTGRPVLLACVPEELHCLPLEALVAALAEVGIRATTLGPRVPVDALQDAVQRTGPAVVGLWAQLPRLARPRVFAELAIRGRMVLALGPGWRTDRLPPGVSTLATLAGAVTEISQAVTV